MQHSASSPQSTQLPVMLSLFLTCLAATTFLSSKAIMANFGQGNFDFTDFTGFTNPIVDQPMQLPHPQPNTYPVAPTFASPNDIAASPVTPVFDPVSGKKRKISQTDLQSQLSLDDAARHVAEEDKRRRNTAASARFRIKKKQREQALEKSAKEMSDRVSILETRIQQLETENTWLKGLITEKNTGSSADISAMLKKHEDTAGERIGSNRNDGVGTNAGETKA